MGIDELYNAIFKLEIINITLNEEDNPQLIFESLNSTGLDLDEGDKIRNYVLMGLSAKEQESFYNKYWNKIEGYTGYDVSLFIRDYLSIKQQSTPAFRNVYSVFKEFVEDKKFNGIEDLLLDLTYYANKYQHLLNGNTPWKKVNGIIYRLNRIKTTVTRPFLMEILCMGDREELPENKIEEIFSIVENYIFRRTICDIPTNALNKICLLLHKEVMRIDGTMKNYVEKLKYVLINKEESGRFPDDEEFIPFCLPNRLYDIIKRNRCFNMLCNYLKYNFTNKGTANGNKETIRKNNFRYGKSCPDFQY